MNNMYNNILEILEDMGYLVFEKNEDDFNITDYIIDSMQFVDFIVRIENKLSIELSDDFLIYDLLLSAKGWANKLVSFYEETYNKN